MKLILSTSNVLNGAPSILRRPANEKSNAELVNSLRTNFISAQEDFALAQEGNLADGVIEAHTSTVASNWISRENNCLYIPALDFSQTGLSEEASQYDITAKLFFLPGTSAAKYSVQAKEAVSMVLNMLHIASIDLLIVSFPNMALDEGCDSNPVTTPASDMVRSAPPTSEEIANTWSGLEAIHDGGLSRQIGVAEFGVARLRELLKQTRIRPAVDQIHVSDCCEAPAELVAFSKEHHIELFTHSDCTDILPSGTIRDLLGSLDEGLAALESSEAIKKDLKGEIKPQWVIKYTAVVKDRGVLEEKGYFAVADIQC